METSDQYRKYESEMEKSKMIRQLQKTDIDCVGEIWLQANLGAHAFIPAQYWQDHLKMVQEMLLQSEVYVYEEVSQACIQGMIGLVGEEIAGIFVRQEMQANGIGKQMLDYVKKKRQRLSLHVYQKNTRAIAFYQKEGFQVLCETRDDATGEMEYIMCWQLNGCPKHNG